MAINLCKTCQHHLELRDVKIDYCTRKPYTEPVHGLVKYYHCQDERSVLGACNVQGIHWEERNHG